MKKKFVAPSAGPIQIALSFDLPVDFEDMDSILIHVIELKKADGKNYDLMAMEADLSPSELSMMIRRTRPFPASKVPGIIRTTLPHGLKVLYWQMGMFLTPEEVKVDRAADVLERFLEESPRMTAEAQRAAAVIAEVLKGKKK